MDDVINDDKWEWMADGKINQMTWNQLLHNYVPRSAAATSGQTGGTQLISSLQPSKCFFIHLMTKKKNLGITPSKVHCNMVNVFGFQVV